MQKKVTILNRTDQMLKQNSLKNDCVNKCEYSYVPWFIFDDRLDYDPSNVIIVIITQATSEGSNYPAHQHSFVSVYFANEV